MVVSHCVSYDRFGRFVLLPFPVTCWNLLFTCSRRLAIVILGISTTLLVVALGISTSGRSSSLEIYLRNRSSSTESSSLDRFGRFVSADLYYLQWTSSRKCWIAILTSATSAILLISCLKGSGISISLMVFTILVYLYRLMVMLFLKKWLQPLVAVCASGPLIRLPLY